MRSEAVAEDVSGALAAGGSFSSNSRSMLEGLPIEAFDQVQCWVYSINRSYRSICYQIGTQTRVLHVYTA